MGTLGVLDEEHRLHLTVCSDLHGSTSQLSLLADHARFEGRSVIAAGDYLQGYIADDLSDHEERVEEAVGQLDILAGLGAYVIPGNHDHPFVYRAALTRTADGLRDIHQATDVIGDGFTVVGWGGMEHSDPIYENFKMGHYYAPDHIVKGMEGLLAGVDDHKDCVLVTHQPVRGYLSKGHVGQELGSAAMREVYDAHSDIGLVISGHSHQAGYSSDKAIDFVAKPRSKDRPPDPDALRVYQMDGYDPAHPNKVVIEYDKDQYDLTCFLNPGSLGHPHSFSDCLDVDVYENGGVRRIEVSFVEL